MEFIPWKHFNLIVYICKPGILKPPSGLRESGSGKRKKVPIPPGTIFEVLLQKKP